MPLPNTGMTFTPFDPLTAAELNDLVENIESLADGTGFNTGAIPTAALANSSVTYQKLASKVPVQMASVGYSSSATGTTQIPSDDTIPQNTEGTEFMSLAITPKSTSNILVIDAQFFGAPSVSADVLIALFQDSTAGALAVDSMYQDIGGGRTTVRLRHIMAAGTVAATTFKLRAGMEVAGTLTFNGVAGGRLYGATVKSSIVITEYNV